MKRWEVNLHIASSKTYMVEADSAAEARAIARDRHQRGLEPDRPVRESLQLDKSTIYSAE